MPRLGLADGFRFCAKFRRVAARFFQGVKPQMDHLVLQNLAQRLVKSLAANAANRKFGIWLLKTLEQKRNRKPNYGFLQINHARRARQTAAPFDGTRRQKVLEILAIELVEKRIEIGGWHEKILSRFMGHRGRRATESHRGQKECQFQISNFPLWLSVALRPLCPTKRAQPEFPFLDSTR